MTVRTGYALRGMRRTPKNHLTCTLSIEHDVVLASPRRCSTGKRTKDHAYDYLKVVHRRGFLRHAQEHPLLVLRQAIKHFRRNHKQLICLYCYRMIINGLCNKQ